MPDGRPPESPFDDDAGFRTSPNAPPVPDRPPIIDPEHADRDFMGTAETERRTVDDRMIVDQGGFGAHEDPTLKDRTDRDHEEQVE